MRKRLLIAALLLVLLAPFVLIAVLLYTETGVRLLAEQISRLERVGVTIEGVSGTLAGPLRVGRFELNHPRVHVVVHDIHIDPQLRGLLIQTIQTRSVTAREALVELRDEQTPPSDRPPRFLPRFLRIDARGAALGRVRYVHQNGMSVDATRVRARVTITSARLRLRDLQVDAEQFDATGGLTLIAGRPLGLEGSIAGHLRLPRTQLALQAQAQGSIDRLEFDGELQAPSRINVAGVFTRPEERWRLTSDVRSAAIDLGAFIDEPPFSLRNVALAVTATDEEVRATGNVGLPEFSERDLTVDARGRYSNRVLHLAGADVRLNDTSAQVHASGTIAFDGEAPTLDVAARWRTLQWPLTGDAVVTSANGAGALRGAFPYEFTVEGEVVGPDVPHTIGSARGELSKEQLTIAAYDLEALGGTVSGAASLHFARPRAWTLSTRAHGVNPAALHADFPGRVNLIAAAQGAGLDRRTNFDLRVEELSGALRGERVHGVGRVQRTRNAWIARNVQVEFGDAQLTLEGALGETIEARWSLHAPTIDDLLPDAAGSIDSRGSAAGPRNAPHVIATLNGRQLRYQDWVADQIDIDADIDAASERASRFSLQAARIGRTDPIIGELRITGEGVASDHRIELDLAGIAANSREAPPRAELQATGAYADERWNGRITGTQLTRGENADRRLEIVEPASATASPDEVQLENLCLAVSAGRVCAQGKWRRGGAWEGTLAGYEIPLAFVLPPSGETAEYAGRIEGRIRANGGPGRAWEADAGMRIIDAAIIYRPPGAPPQTLNLGTGGLAATATPERINFSFGVQAFADTFLYANAELLRNGGNDVMQLPLTGDMRARAADANILPLLFPEIDHAAGLMTANATITGSLAAPEINGRIELANGEFDSYRVNLALRDLSLIADLASNGLDFRGSGRAGEGQVALDGRFLWRDGETRGNLHLRGENLLVADLPEYRVVASPDLRFEIDGEHMGVAGDVVIPNALIQPNELIGAVRTSDDARYVGDHRAELEGRFTVRSEVRITMGEDVRIDAFGLKGRITGGVGTTIHTGETPIGRGELGVAEGRYEAYGQELDINRGRLLFDVSPLDDPGLDIEARRQVDTTTVGLNVRGTLQEPRLTFFSDPSMPQTQIVSYLLTGKSVDSIQSTDVATVRSMEDTLTLQGGGLLASQLGRRVGLDEVGVESSIDSAGESNSSLVLGKFLSPRLFISYGISLTESINTLKLRYTISDRWIFRTEAGEQQSADVEFTVER